MSYSGPFLGDDSFLCPHCGAICAFDKIPILKAIKSSKYASSFVDIYDTEKKVGIQDFAVFYDEYEVITTRCHGCGELCFWIDGKLVYPTSSGITPAEGMPDSIRKPFLEAQLIAGASPWAACALLRICLERLCDCLGAKQGTLFGRIESLGLSESEKQIWSAIRKIGNDAAHECLFPYSVNASENIAFVLSNLLNALVTRHISAEVVAKKALAELEDSQRRG